MKLKPLVLLLLAAIAGVIVGAFAMEALRRPDYYGTEYPGMIRALTADHLLHAKLLRDGRSPEVLQMIESTLPSSVLHFDMFKLRDEGDLTQLWQIREYGEKHHITFTPEVAAVLATLPPKPASFCEIGENAKGRTMRESHDPTVTPRAP